MEKKFINNAISSYFMLWILMLIPTKNPYINNSFVKSHAKTASFIHILMLINYLIFIHYKFLANIVLFDFNINIILHNILFLVLLAPLIFGIFKASTWKELSIKQIWSFAKIDKIYDVKSTNLDEKEILYTIFSLIPVLGFLAKWQKTSKIIENNIKLNLISSVFLTIIMLFWYENIFLLLLLAYIIFIVFFGVFLVKENIIIFNLEFIPTIEELYYKIWWFNKYILNFLLKKEFKDLNTTTIDFYKNIKNKYSLSDSKLSQEINKIPTFFYYLPIINLLGIIDIKSKYKNHIINWFLITLISILCYFIYSKLLIFVLFICLFWYSEIQNITYRIPFLFDIYNIFENIFNSIKNFFSKFYKKRGEITEVTLKI